ncbi:MAG: cation:proton antiporter [Rhizobiales bacterium]|nr:cation:proton antiporter [Hyphomicrobiales bacterium]
MAIPTMVLVLAALLAVVSLAEPLAGRLRLPSSVILALLGILIGTASTLIGSSSGPAMEALAETIADLPINSQVFLFIFLPALLFQGALNIDARDMAEDAVPIFTMAVVAVLVATFAIGAALWPISGAPLIACLLVGAIVATTDPSAVIAIFRDLGAPGRLTRLVEGESLLNDAVAITLFVIFLELLATGHEVELGATALRVAVVPVAGGLIGLLAGRVFASLLRRGGENRLVQVSLTLALPYLVFVAAEHWHLSGPVAVAAAGLTISALGPARVSPSSWRYVKEVWEQLAFWAGSLVFILAAILVPRLLRDIGWQEALLLATLVATALLARAAVLFGFMPILSALRVSPAISPSYRAVMLWGGLRGAVTLALALAVTESPGVPEEIKRFVAVLATCFVLFTLLVQGTTLRPLMRALGLDRLSPADAALREQAIALSHAEVREAIATTAKGYALSPELAADVAAEYSGGEERAAEARDGAAGISGADRLALGLAALAAREHDLILEHLEARTVSPGMVGLLLSRARRLLDATRSAGCDGYRREAAAALRFSRKMRLANALHTRLRLGRPLENELSNRFEALLVNRIVLNELFGFADGQLKALLGSSVAEAARFALTERREATTRSLDALRLQYPEYAEELERRFLRMSALRREEHGYQQLFEEGLIGPEVRRDLVGHVAERHRRDARPKLDLKLNIPTLIKRVPLFERLGERDVEDVSRLMRPAFAIPGQRLIARGERGDAAWFIASGAVEVDTGRGQVRLGRGDFFGELALLTGAPRMADVTAIAFCELLLLYARDFRVFLDERPEIRAEIEAVAADRLGQSRGAA